MSDVGTTYKRALERFHLSRDCGVPLDFSALSLIDNPDNWLALDDQHKDKPVRKPRDFDAELKALSDKARALRDRKLVQLGELAVATGADALPVEMLAGAMLAAAQSKDPAMKETWRKSGAAFFQRKARGTYNSADRDASGGAADHGNAQPAATNPRPS